MYFNRGSWFLLFSFFCPLLCFSQGINFFREDITIKILPEECEITGIYYFANTTDYKLLNNLYYPFFNDSTLSVLPDKYSVKNLITGENLKYIKQGSGLMFPVISAPGDTVIIEVIYSQLTPYQSMEYILTTTKYWGNPFDEASYSVLCPKEFQLIAMYPEYDSISIEENVNTYHVVRNNFLPVNNFSIKWRNK